MWAHFRRVCKPNAAIVLTASQPFTSALGASNLAMLKYSWAYVKRRPVGHLNAHKRPMNGFEDVLIFYSKQPTYNPQGLSHYGKVNRRTNGDCYRGAGQENLQEFSGYPSGVIHFGQNEPSVHPTQKPVALMAYLIRTYTQAGETVLDCTMGSGTTGVACKQEGRNFIGIEQDADYFAVAERRIADCDSLLSFGNAVLYPKESL